MVTCKRLDYRILRLEFKDHHYDVDLSLVLSQGKSILYSVALALVQEYGTEQDRLEFNSSKLIIEY